MNFENIPESWSEKHDSNGHKNRIALHQKMTDLSQLSEVSGRAIYSRLDEIENKLDKVLRLLYEERVIQ